MENNESIRKIWWRGLLWRRLETSSRERAKGIDNVGGEFEDMELIKKKESYSVIVKKWWSPGK